MRQGSRHPKGPVFFLFFSWRKGGENIWVFWILQVPNVFPPSSHQVLIQESKRVSTHNKRAACVSSKLPQDSQFTRVLLSPFSLQGWGLCLSLHRQRQRKEQPVSYVYVSSRVIEAFINTSQITTTSHTLIRD